MAPKSGFVMGEKVLCFHGPLLYEAKCLNVQTKDKIVKYFIHYSGWNKNWDEWVPECRVLKYNEENIKKQKELSKVHLKAKKARSAKKDGVVKKDPIKKTEALPSQDKTPKPKPKPAEKKIESLPKTEQKPLPDTEQKQLVPETEEPSSELIEMKDESLEECTKVTIELEDMFEQEEPDMEVEEELGLPEPLEDWLLDDYDLVNNQKKIVHLPARITVEHILANYVKDKVSDNQLPAPEEKRIIDFANHTRHVFDVLLGKACLYKFEKPQYLDMHKNYFNQRKCEIYGGAHLLRMFSKMDEMLKEANPPGPALTETRNDVQDFIKYLSENLQFFDHRDYEVVPPEYHRRFM